MLIIAVSEIYLLQAPVLMKFGHLLTLLSLSVDLINVNVLIKP